MNLLLLLARTEVLQAKSHVACLLRQPVRDKSRQRHLSHCVRESQPAHHSPRYRHTTPTPPQTLKMPQLIVKGIVTAGATIATTEIALKEIDRQRQSQQDALAQQRSGLAKRLDHLVAMSAMPGLDQRGGAFSSAK